MMSSRLGLVAPVIATLSPSQLSPVVIQMTWAVIASVFAWLGTNSVAAMCTPFLSRSAAAGRRRAGPSPAGRRTPSSPAPSPAAPSSPRRSRPPRSQPSHGAQRGQRRVGAPPGATKATSLPSFATYIGSIPRISAAPATAGSTGTSPSRSTIATPEARASSLSTEATPPRVASRIARSAGPAASEQRVGRRPQRARVGDDLGLELELAAGEHDRHAVVADRAGDEDPVAGPQRSRARATARGSSAPDAGRADVHLVGVAALDDLGVAGDDLDAGRRGGGGDRLDLGPQHVARRAPPRGSARG